MLSPAPAEPEIIVELRIRGRFSPPALPRAGAALPIYSAPSMLFHPVLTWPQRIMGWLFFFPSKHHLHWAGWSMLNADISYVVPGCCVKGFPELSTCLRLPMNVFFASHAEFSSKQPQPVGKYKDLFLYAKSRPCRTKDNCRTGKYQMICAILCCLFLPVMPSLALSNLRKASGEV